MLKKQTFQDLLEAKINSLSKESLLLISNFLILEKIQKLNSMTDISLTKYLKNRNLNGFISNTPVNEVKERMINDLIDKSIKLENHSVFVLRSESYSLLEYFKEDSKVQSKLLDFLSKA